MFRRNIMQGTQYLVLATVISAGLLAHGAEKGGSAGKTTFRHVDAPMVDDAQKDPAFLDFRDKLFKIVEKRDVTGLLEVLDSTIRCSFGDDEGIDAFKKMWKLNAQPEQSAVWKELGAVLRMGGKLNKSDKGAFFIAPYVYFAVPDDFDEESEYAVVIGDGVRVRSKPDEKSEAIAKVSKLVVRLYDEVNPITSTIGGETFPWRHIGLPDGTEGYIWGKYLRSAIDFRAGFSNESGRWKMIYFLAGD